MNNFAASIFHVVIHNRFIANVKSDDEPFTIPDFPWLKFTKSDFTHPFDMAELSGPHLRIYHRGRHSGFRKPGYSGQQLLRAGDKIYRILGSGALL
uniref:Uncharacterized protein n=1 Tax=Nelumbo nucifera TaxID=4432 RepID=A0A822Y9E9_NELNU|nr:TPA_asm: hypothetical protein HUJ06_030370 [Nelumbo nucifera]